MVSGLLSDARSDLQKAEQLVLEAKSALSIANAELSRAMGLQENRVFIVSEEPLKQLRRNPPLRWSLGLCRIGLILSLFVIKSRAPGNSPWPSGTPDSQNSRHLAVSEQLQSVTLACKGEVAH